MDPIRAYLNASRNKSTVNKTENYVKRFRQWLMQPPRNEKRQLIAIPSGVMDRYVGGYLMEVKKINDDDYEPDSLTSIHRGINRKLEELGYGYSIVTSQEFQTSKKVLEARRRELKQGGKGNHPFKADSLTEQDEERLWEVLGTLLY